MLAMLNIFFPTVIISYTKLGNYFFLYFNIIIFVCFRFHNDECGMAPFFVFGDFNFRADTQGVVKVSRSFFCFLLCYVGFGVDALIQAD